jgi:predicted transglutaminase-like cysteine proteinase
MSGPTRIAAVCLLFAICCSGRPDYSHANAFSIVVIGSEASADERTSEERMEDRRPPTANSSDRGLGPAALSPESFGLPTLPTRPNDISAKWTELQSRIRADEGTLATCRSGEAPCPVAARRFLSLIEVGLQRQGRARFGVINRAVNLSIRPVSDWAQYGVDDFWASPLATMSSGAGDCEDYAIVKYVALRQLGVAPNDLRLLIVYDAKHGANHAVAAVRHESEWLILDNRTLTMVNADAIQNYWPLFVLDHQGVTSMVTAFLFR